jgi:two-component system invasion response regulator UvrY
MIRIVIVDDHPMVRRGLREALSRERDIVIVAEAGTPDEVVPAITAQPCDVLLLDIGLPGRGGIEVLKDVRAQWPDLRVLIVSSYPESQYALRVIKAGASGYVTKTCAPQELVRAVRVVMATRCYISDAVAGALASYAQRTTPRDTHQLLSDRELQVLKLIVAGQTSSEIAATLSLSIKTVSTYRTRLLEKLQIRTNADLIRYALEHGVES